MKTLAKLYRQAQLYAHMAHNLAKGPTFFEDHEFFGEAYAAYEEAYDSVVERMIGQAPDEDFSQTLLEINQSACAALYPATSNNACLGELLEMEVMICAEIAVASVGASPGTQNLLQGLCDLGEVRQYKIQQRLK